MSASFPHIKPTIFICIPVHNRVQYTLKCIESIYNQTFKNFIIIICDDGSSDNTASILAEKFPEVIIERGNGHLWWTGGINKCVSKALSLANKGDYIYTLNNDTELFPNTLEILVKIANKQKESMIGTLNLFYSDHTRIENSAFIMKNRYLGFRRFNKWGEKFSGTKDLHTVDGIAGKGVLIPVQVFEKIGLYNQIKLPHYHADFEFSYRAKRAGISLFLSQEARLLSHQELSGLGSINTDPHISEFLKSFTNIKSTHHIPSQYNFNQLVYGKYFILFFMRDFLFINLGFLKRYVKHKFHIR